MKDIAKIAFCTDFSDASQVSIDTLLFNLWAFKCDIDLYHLVRDSNPKDSIDRLYALKEELENSLGEGHTVNICLFDKGKICELIEQINLGNYFLTLLGHAAFCAETHSRTFTRELYENLKCDISIIPVNHGIRIENTGIIALELQNIDWLHLLIRMQELFEFNHIHMKIMIASKDLLSTSDLAFCRSTIGSILPKLKYELINCTIDNAKNSILTEVTTSRVDWLTFFKNDFFDTCVLSSLENELFPNNWDTGLHKYYVSEELIEGIKNGNSNASKLTLKQI